MDMLAQLVIGVEKLLRDFCRAVVQRQIADPDAALAAEDLVLQLPDLQRVLPAGVLDRALRVVIQAGLRLQQAEPFLLLRLRGAELLDPVRERGRLLSVVSQIGAQKRQLLFRPPYTAASTLLQPFSTAVSPLILASIRSWIAE